MRRFLALALRAAALAISVLFTGQQPPLAQTPVPNPNSELAERSAKVEQIFGQLVRADGPGAAVMVIQQGRVVKSQGYGLANLETRTPVTAQTLFDLGSVSKQFTAMAVMMLAERGRLSLEDPLTKFFPEFPDYARKISVRHLLTHTSGLADAISPRIFRPGYQPTSRDLLKLMTKERGVNFEPGARFEYNNAGYVLLALIVEKVARERFSKFMDANVFEPLGMAHTLVYDETRQKVANLALSYSNDAGAFRPSDYLSDRYFYGPKGVLTSLEDLYRWAQAIELGRLVSPAMLAQAFTPVKLSNGTTAPYGFGWYVGDDNGLAVMEHAGGYLGYRAAIRLYPQRRTTVIVLSNNPTIEAGPLSRRIGQIYLGEQSPQASATGLKVPLKVLRSYVGRYEGDPAVMANLILEITLEDGELYITSPIRPKTKLLAKSATDFTVAETASSLTFHLDAQGAVSGLTLQTRRGIISARRLPDR